MNTKQQHSGENTDAGIRRRGRRVRHGEAERGITENHEGFAFDPDLRERRSKKTNGDHAFDADTEAKMICLI